MGAVTTDVEEVGDDRETGVLVLADELPVAAAATLVTLSTGTTRCGEGEGSETQSNEDGLDKHVCGVWMELDWLV